MKKRSIIILVAAVLLIGAGIWIIFTSGKKELVMNTTFAEPGTVELTVMATGYVQPVEKVEVGTQVSGIIERIYVDFNSYVKRGQLLAELDKLTLNERLSQAQASLQSSESDLTYARQNYNRIKQLFDVKAATQVSYEEAVNSLTRAETSVADARANLQQAEVNLGYANITSPIDGIVLERAVEEGQTVAASFNTPTLFTIANDLTKMQVEADVDEADIGRVENGQRVTFTVDAYADDVFEGTVSQIRLQPVVTNNVVTYTVIVEAPNPDEKLFPGMTANITIVTRTEQGLTIPVEAQQFTMTDDVLKRLQQTGPPMNMSEGAGTGTENGNAGPDNGYRPAAGSPGNGQRSSRNGANGNGESRGNTVWVKNGDQVVPRQITTGINDGVNVIVNSGLSSGEEVILSASLVKKTRQRGQATSNPLVPSPPRGRR